MVLVQVDQVVAMERIITKGESHFVLVHGSCHGAWCWYKLIKLLQSAGHMPLMDFMESLHAEEKVILVGHSMGGIAVLVAKEKF
ncbi:hypothetical protein LguiA_017461 [Lonicera macranthoides]